jgi:hypothetical protein
MDHRLIRGAMEPGPARTLEVLKGTQAQVMALAWQSAAGGTDTVSACWKHLPKRIAYAVFKQFRHPSSSSQ